MAPMHTVTSEKIREPQSESRTSRWNAILREGSTGLSTTTRQRTQGPDMGKCHTSYHRNQGVNNGRQFSTNHSGGCNSDWRRRAANDNVDVALERSAEDDAVIEAIQKIVDSIKYFLQENQRGADDVHRSTEQLAATIFHDSDVTQFSGRQFFPNTLNATKTLPNVSNEIVWKAGCSLIKQVHLLSESPTSCCQLIHSLSCIAFHCFQSSSRQGQQLRSGQFITPDDTSKVDAIECLPLLVEILRCGVFKTTVANMDEVMKCKSTLLSCMATFLSVTSNDTVAPYISTKNKNCVQSSSLPWGAEKMVNMLVKETILPFIELLLKPMDVSTSSENLNYYHGAMECIYILLRDPKWRTAFETVVPGSTAQLSKYATAILAPLIVDILPDGKEKQHSNPLRTKVLSLICTYWDLSFQHITERTQISLDTTHQPVNVYMPCQCMAAALNALSALRKSKPQNIQDDPHEINVSKVAHQLQRMIKNEGLRCYRPKFLSIMALLCLAYPTPSANQWHIFLEQSPVNEESLLSIIDKGGAALTLEKFECDYWIALPNALYATSVLLSAMPFALWISSGEARSLTRMSGGNFSSRVRTALLAVINCICNLMTVTKERISITSISESSIEIIMRLVSEVAGKLCTILPFDGENSILLHSSIRIIQCAGDIYVNSVSVTILDPAGYTLWSKAGPIFGSVIIESLGGRSNASGTDSVAKISASATAWLSSPSSYDFIALLLTDSRWTCPSARERMEMLSVLARSSPSTLVREPFNLALFCEVCAIQTESENGLNSRTLGLKLIESFIYGRKFCSIECTTQSVVDMVIRQTFSPLLQNALNDSSAVVRTCAVSSFGSLLRRDWLENLDSFVNSKPLESILKLCTAKYEDVASVRAASCKAIGDIIITCALRDGTDGNHKTDSHINSFACLICEVMKCAIVDKVASVRSMALYAIGNTSLALKEHLEQTFQPIIPSMRDIFCPICVCLDDSDDKVVFNAIRTISHVSYFVYGQDSQPKISPAAMLFIRNLLLKLSSKVNSPLDDAVYGPPQGLTWKQRSGAKKQTRGSCSTIGVLLNYPSILQNVDDTILEISLSCLFRCIQHSRHVNDKIITTAVRSLLGLPSALWQRISCKCDIIGRGLAAIFSYLEIEKSGTQPHYLDIEDLAVSLLDLANEEDFCHFFLIGENSIPFSVLYFYQWLVAKDVKFSTFEKISAAVSSESVSRMLDVSVIQIFLSRTIRQQHQDLPCKDNDVDPSSRDEGDEL